MIKPTLSVLLLVLLPFLARAASLPEFSSDQDADRWFREHSSSYRNMAEVVEAAGGYTIGVTEEMPGGVAYYKGGRGYIELNNTLKGPHRFSILIFEVTNLYQEKKHRQVTDRVRRGEIEIPTEFAMLRESIEYDGIHLHYKVLKELEPVLDSIPAEMITWLSSTAKTYAGYQVPCAYEYMKAQLASGHTSHYVKLFEKHRAEYLDSLKAKGK